MTTSSHRATPAARPPRRTRRPAPRSASFLERNRNRLLIAIGAVVFALLVGMAYLGFTRPVFACLNEFDPTPAPTWVAPTTDPAATPLPSGATPAPAVTPPPPGYVQPDMGHVHVAPGTTITYRYCPPASGRHYNVTGQGPIQGGIYGPDDVAVPPGWVHNLEHGALVLLYKCPGPGCSDDGQAAVKALFAKLPPSPICNFPVNQLSVAARFDEMASNYMAVVWDVVLPLDSLDEAAILDFYERQAEQYNPEKLCAAPTPTPGPATPTPAATTAPTGAPAGSPAPSGSAPATTGPTPS